MINVKLPAFLPLNLASVSYHRDIKRSSSTILVLYIILCSHGEERGQNRPERTEKKTRVTRFEGKLFI